MVSAEGEAGFSLVEALVALALLTGTASSVMVLLAANRTLQARAEAELTHALKAEALLARVGLDIPVRPGSVSGAGRGGDWSVAILPFRDDDEPETARTRPLYEVVVRVTAGPAAGGVVLRSLRRGPA